MESISDINLEFEDNPYLQYSLKELLEMRKIEKVNNADIKVWLGIDNSEDPDLKRAYRTKNNVEKKKKKKMQKRQDKIQIRFDRALNNNVLSYHFNDNGSHNFVTTIKQSMIKFITEEVRKFGSIKVNIAYTAKFIKDERIIEVPITVPGSSAKIITDVNRIPDILSEVHNQNREVVDDMPLAESGCIFFFSNSREFG